ncbi:MAG TPA: GspH/FimT family protein [Rudaea sp.]
MRSSQQGGYTLVEMIVVVVLVAIVLGVVTMSLSKSFSGARTQAASHDMIAALRYTRGQAIVKGKEQALELDVQNNRYKAPGRAMVQLPKNMHLGLLTAENELTSETTGRIRFFPDGASTGGHITVYMGNIEWRINVDWLTGAVSREEVRR